MKSEERARKFMGRHRQCDRLKMWSSLQGRMTISYVGVCLATALLVELLFVVIILVVLPRLPFVDKTTLNAATHTAQVYALEASVQAEGAALDPRSTFQPGQPSSLALSGADSSESVPYIDTHSSTPQMGAFTLLIAPNGQVLASSYPARYPVATPVAHLLPEQTQLILNALAGKAGSMVEITAQGHVASVAQPVLSKDKKPIGVIYVQLPPVPIGQGENIFSVTIGLLGSALFWTIFLAPVGAVFGVLTTRGLVRRIHRLVTATAQFAHGDYTQRVASTKQDEVGQLEQQFNSMAEQLVESMEQRQTLIEQQARMEERARIEQELHTAQYMQRALLPKEVPLLPGWQLAPFYRPAREVGGDFYDFLPFEDGQLGIIIGDVTGKGVPAALVMATTCTMLRTAAQGTSSPGEVLARVNDLLCARIPPGMFVTCFYAMLDPGSGRLYYANAGHEWPYQRHSGCVSELQATGMPLGMFPEMRYDEQEVSLAPGESLLLYSDGLVEAHNPRRDMFGLPHLKALIEAHAGGATLIDVLLGELATFTGVGWEQEDDVTLVTLQRISLMNEQQAKSHLLLEATFASIPNNEQQAMEQVAEVVRPLHLPPERLANLKTAVAEAVMNAMEHGNQYQPEKPVTLQVRASETALSVLIRDEGAHRPMPAADELTEPDLTAKLAELQSPRGWGLFLIRNLVDEMHLTGDDHHHIVELVMHLETPGSTSQPSIEQGTQHAHEQLSQ